MALENNVTEMPGRKRTRMVRRGEDHRAVRDQLGRILNSLPFQRSERLRRFLDYVVNRALQDPDEAVREVELALDVFDKRGSFDSRTDPIVRVEARRLRKLLENYYASEGVDDPITIVIPARGYTPKFLPRQTGKRNAAPIRREREKQEKPAGATASIAVLPFLNMTNAPEQEIFCQGITEELTNALTKVDDVKVLSRTSAYQFKGVAVDLRKVGKELGVQTLLEGSVRADGERIRITAQLVSSSDGFHLWSETFDVTMTDLFDVEENVAVEMASQIVRQLSSTSYPS